MSKDKIVLALALLGLIIMSVRYPSTLNRTVTGQIGFSVTEFVQKQNNILNELKNRFIGNFLLSSTASNNNISFRDANNESEGLDKIKARLMSNFFPSPVGDGNFWLSVSPGQYLNQFYSRDTFVTAKGAVYMGQPYISYLKQAVQWFSQNMEDDGYIPIWFRKTSDLNVYYFSPYNRTALDGGVKQADHVLDYINTTWDIYSWSGDTDFLSTQLPYAERAWKYLADQTNDYLIDIPVSKFSGLDWADKILRGGKSTFVEANWYQATISLAYLEKSHGNITKSNYYENYANGIKFAIQKELWSNSKPININKKVGHFVGWIDNGYPKNYFEVDSNSAVVGLGIATDDQANEVMKFINDNLATIVSSTAASRDVMGSYSDIDMFGNFKPGEYQNGGYWYIVSYYLSDALSRNKQAAELQQMFRDSLDTFVSTSSGLAEWYYPDGKIGGASNYSWSLAFPYYLLYHSILGVRTTPEGLTVDPVIADTMLPTTFNLSYRDKHLHINIKRNKFMKISNTQINMTKNKDVYITIQ